MPRRANRVEKSVCLEKIVARILNLYIGNVSGRQGCRPLRRYRKRLFLAVGTRRAVSAVANKLYRKTVVIEDNNPLRKGRLPRRPLHKNCVAIFVWTRHAVSLRLRCYYSTAKLSFNVLKKTPLGKNPRGACTVN